MMKKVYEKPSMAIERFTNEDVITTSGGLVTSKFNVQSGLDGENVVNF
jgi:hypothetical protein